MTSAPRIRTGALKRRADLQARTETSDGAGGVTVAWVTERKVWCEIRPLTGVQKLEADRREPKVTHVISARYAADITPHKRLLHRGVPYLLEAVFQPEAEAEFVVAHASTGVAT